MDLNFVILEADGGIGNPAIALGHRGVGYGTSLRQRAPVLNLLELIRQHALH